MGSNRETIRDFAALYIKAQMKIALLITIPICALFFAVSLLADAPQKDLLITLIPFALDVVFLGFLCLKTWSLGNMIQNQEMRLGVHFSEETMMPLYPKTLFFYSDAWFIKAGCWAFHKDCLEKITVGVTGEKTPARHYVVEFHTIDGKVFTDRNMRSGEIQKLKQWHNQ